MPRKIICISALCIMLGAMSSEVAATQKDNKPLPPTTQELKRSYLGIRVHGSYPLSITGDAGKGNDAPEYSDIFDQNLGFGAEVTYRTQTMPFSLHLGLSSINYDGQRFHGVKFEDWEQKNIYVGLKFHFTRNNTNFDPYMRCDVGITSYDGLKIKYKGMKLDYWDESTEPYFGLGIGVNFNFSRNFGAFAEIQLNYKGAPDEQFKAAEADSYWELPITFGLQYNF